MTTLLFARHGQASFGQKNYDKLSELGTKQAALLGTQYAQAERQIDAIITGSLVRQQDSAAHFLTAYQMGNDSESSLSTPATIEELNEFNHTDVFIKYDPSFATEFGVMTAIADAPVPKLRLAELFNEAMLRWHSGEHDADYIESWSDFNQRVQNALTKISDYAQSQQLETILIFTSGGVIAAIVASLLGQGSQTAYQINRKLINTGVTSVVLKDNEPRLLSLNEHSHLYQAGQKFITWH